MKVVSASEECLLPEFIVNAEEKEEEDRLDITITRYKMEIGSAQTNVNASHPR